jgi:hypothetical protein
LPISFENELELDSEQERAMCPHELDFLFLQPHFNTMIISNKCSNSSAIHNYAYGEDPSPDEFEAVVGVPGAGVDHNLQRQCVFWRIQLLDDQTFRLILTNFDKHDEGVLYAAKPEWNNPRSAVHVSFKSSVRYLSESLWKFV